MLSFHNHPELKTRTLVQLHKSLTYRDMGIPSILEDLKKCIIKNLDNKSAKEFSIQFIEAIPVGVDLSGVYPKWVVRSLRRVRTHALRVHVLDKGKIAIDRIIELIEKPTDDKEIKVNTSAATAVAFVASDLVYADASSAAAAAAAYAYADGGAEIIKQRDDLIELLREVGNE